MTRRPSADVLSGRYPQVHHDQHGVEVPSPFGQRLRFASPLSGKGWDVSRDGGKNAGNGNMDRHVSHFSAETQWISLMSYLK